MNKVFTHYDDMEPNDIVRKLDRPPSHEFPYTHKFVKVVDDVEMAYVESGQLDSDKVVLFVHGAPEQAYIWRNIMPYVENYARVIAVEQIGHGLSDKPDLGYHIEDYVKYFFSFVETLGLDNITIVGQDWGSVIGPYYGACNPDNGQCVVVGLVDGESCDDGLDCTVGTTCQGGACVGFVADECDDDNPLLNTLDLPPGTLDFVADRSTVKQGLHTPGLHLPIVPPVTLVRRRPDAALLLTWNFADEIFRLGRDLHLHAPRHRVPAGGGVGGRSAPGRRQPPRRVRFRCACGHDQRPD